MKGKVTQNTSCFFKALVPMCPWHFRIPLTIPYFDRVSSVNGLPSNTGHQAPHHSKAKAPVTAVESEKGVEIAETADP